MTIDINPRLRRLGDRLVGPGQPVYLIGEIGINHNGDLANALRADRPRRRRRPGRREVPEADAGRLHPA